MNIDNLIKKYNEFFEKEIADYDTSIEIADLNSTLKFIDQEMLKLKIKKELYQNLLKKAESNKEKQVQRCLNKIFELMEIE